MGNELTHFSVLDDESSTSYFLNWAGHFGSGATLRGGNRVVSDTPSDTQIEIETTPLQLASNTASRTIPLLEHEISRASSKTPFPQHKAPFSLTKQSPPPVTETTTATHLQDLPGAFLATPRDARQTELTDSSTPGGSSVVSIAHRRQVYQNKHPGPRPIAVNKLDEDPGKTPVTPTQQRLLERLGQGEQQVSPTNSVPSANRSEVNVPEVGVGEAQTQKADLTLFTTKTKDIGPKDQPDTMDLFDAMEKQYFSLSTSAACHLAAEGLHSQAAEHVEDKPIADTLTTSQANGLSKDQTADTNSDEGGMDLTPVLKALGARSTASTSITTTIPEPSKVTTEHAQAATAEAADEDMPQPSVDDLSANGKMTPAVPAAELDGKKTHNAPVEPTVKETLEVADPKSRTAVLKNLPDDSDYTFVQCLVYGAAIESMKLYPGTGTARVMLTDVEGCQRYIDSCSTGIKIKVNRVQHVVLVERSPEPDTIDDRLQAYLDCGATRVVKVEDADEDMTTKGLYRFAQGPTQSREVESIMDSCRRGIRNIVFRFSGITDAVAFRSALLRDRSWRSKNPHFTEDPCESATGPRSE